MTHRNRINEAMRLRRAIFASAIAKTRKPEPQRNETAEERTRRFLRELDEAAAADKARSGK